MTWNVGPWSLQKDYLVIVRRKILSLWWGANPWCSRGTCYFQWFYHAFVIFFLSISCFCFLCHCIHPSQPHRILWDSMEIPTAVFWALIYLQLAHSWTWCPYIYMPLCTGRACCQAASGVQCFAGFGKSVAVFSVTASWAGSWFQTWRLVLVPFFLFCHECAQGQWKEMCPI